MMRALSRYSSRKSGGHCSPILTGMIRPRGIRCRNRRWRSGHALPPDLDGSGLQKPSFDVLIVTPNDPSNWDETRHQLQRLRRREDPFTYHVVMVGSFEDAALATVLNESIQSVVIYDGFRFSSGRDAPVLRDHLTRYAKLNEENLAAQGKDLGTRLAAMIKNFRPELDIYLITDRSVEALAASDETAAIRRIFFDIEEVLEIHLSIMDGVSDRYRTPYFSNLVNYSQRPIGTFHALPMARGKSVFKSTGFATWASSTDPTSSSRKPPPRPAAWTACWSRPATSSGAQELAARAFGARSRVLRHQRHLDHQQDGRPGTSGARAISSSSIATATSRTTTAWCCRAAQPLYVEAFPMTEYSMYGAVPLRTIKQALLDGSGPKGGSIA